MNVSDVVHGAIDGCRRQQHGIGRRLARVVAVHAGEADRSHVARAEEHARTHEEEHLVIAIVVEPHAEPLELGPLEQGAAWMVSEQIDEPPAGAIVPRPEARHSRVVGGQVVRAHVKSEALHVAAQIVGPAHRRHAVVREDEHADVVAAAAGRLPHATEPRLVPVELRSHAVGLVDVEVEIVVEPREIEEKDARIGLGRSLGGERQDLGVGVGVVVVALPRDARVAEAVKDRRTVEAAGLIDVALLGQVELRQVRHRIVVDREVARVTAQPSRQVLDDPSRHRVLDQRLRQPSERPRPAER